MSDLSNQKNQNLSAGFLVKLFVPFALAFFMSCLLRTINSVMAPTFIKTFNMTAQDLGVMTSSYFLAFAIAQIPLGVCLDRYNAGRTLSAFLIFGIIGAIVFATAKNVFFLFVGRALVGLGVSGCLMAAYKAFGDFLPKEKIPVFNSLESFVGGVGGMVATTPINIALEFVSWRTLFIILAGLTAVVAIILFFIPPKKETISKKGESVVEQLKGMGKICTSKLFWRLAPLAIFGQAIYLALNSLWIGPWYKDVAGASPDSVPNLLFIASLGITVGYLVNGFVANYFKEKMNFKIFNIIIISMSIYTVLLGGIALFPKYGTILWPLFVFLGPFSLLSYPVFTSMFDSSMSGRALTAYNMFVFIMSTVIQSCVGTIIDKFPLVNGSYNPEGYKIGLLVLTGCLTLSVVWAIFYRKNKNEIDY